MKNHNEKIVVDCDSFTLVVDSSYSVFKKKITHHGKVKAYDEVSMDVSMDAGEIEENDNIHTLRLIGKGATGGEVTIKMNNEAVILLLKSLTKLMPHFINQHQDYI